MQQLGERVLRIEILRPIRNVVSAEQNLCHRLPHVTKELIPHTHKFALSDCRKSLHLW